MFGKDEFLYLPARIRPVTVAAVARLVRLTGMAKNSPLDPVTGLSVGRILIGVGSIANPALTAKLFGLSPDANPQLGYFARMFGVREIAIGSLTLLAKGNARRTMVLAGIAVDGGDAATGVIGLARKDVPTLAGGLLVGVALCAAGSGVAAAVLDRAGDA